MNLQGENLVKPAVVAGYSSWVMLGKGLKRQKAEHIQTIVD
jgi:hypothetical protein